MAENYYLDTSIWLDIYEKRGKNGELAIAMLDKLLKNEKSIFYSDIILTELRNLGYSSLQIQDILKSVSSDSLEKVLISKDEIKESKVLAIKRKTPRGDVLHAILARNNDAELITTDQHFLRLKDIKRSKSPGEVIQNL